MSTFYSRYVPPSRPVQNLETYDRPSSKRKHDDAHQTPQAGRKRAKTDEGIAVDKLTESQSRTSSKKLRTSQSNDIQPRQEKDNASRKEAPVTQSDSLGKEVLAKYSVTQVSYSSNVQSVLGRSKEAPRSEALSPNAALEEASECHEVKKRRKKSSPQKGRPEKESAEAASDKAQLIDNPVNQRHAGIRHKFETSKAKTRLSVSSSDARGEDKESHGRSEDANQGDATSSVLHGLEPLPQPLQVELSNELPSYSTLPGWMAKPMWVALSATSDFKDLDLDSHVLSNLQKKGISKAFAVQAAVLPLLSKGRSRHRGDICISAATGSGKTLAYVLPMIQALRNLVGTKLRGLIVVPTRELVAQAREVCEVCAAGTNVRIATALGSRALKDEQNILIEEHTVYDPEQYISEREKPINWTNFGLEHLLAHSEDDSLMANCVKKFASKVDVLITTPGRLVDHLRSTPGFNLDDIQWVVIDEADRLLNESFQEWIEVVMPALNSDVAVRSRDSLLRELRLDAPRRKVQKVILSATMTQDISKLNSLDLSNPKLVVVGDLPKPKALDDNGVAMEDAKPVPDANRTFNLPPTLMEFAVSIGDGSEKPLYLLQLLNSHILKPSEQRNRLPASSSRNSSSTIGLGISNGTSLESDETSSSALSDTSDTDSSSDDTDSDSDASSSNIPPPTTHPLETALVFTRSTEAATRLSRLLSILSPSLAPYLGTLTKSTNSSSSRKTLSQFRQGKVSLVIATDRASRGLDLPGLAHVVSYDIPTSATTYVHRVGRTARAGKEGKAWTLVGHREARWFWNEIGKGGSGNGVGEARIVRGERKVKRVNVEIDKEGDGDELRKRYEDALGMLAQEVRGNT
jgi:ATP-dependent RNA helicase DDX51/DBP6